MTLDELNQIKKDATSASYAASDAKRASEEIGKIRRENMPSDLSDVVLPFTTGFGTNRSGYLCGDTTSKAIKQAVLDLLPDILRLAEMRLEATHKHQSALARARNARLSAFLGEPHEQD